MVLTSKDVKHGRIVHTTIVVLAVQFSEDVHEFSQQMITLSGCEIIRLTSLTNDRYSLRIKITAKVGEKVAVQVQQQAAKRIGRRQYDAMMNTKHFNAASNVFELYYNCKNVKKKSS